MTLQIQKQSPIGVLRNMCSANMEQIYRTPMQKCDFSKVANQFYWNHTSAWVFFYEFAAYFAKQLFWWKLMGNYFCKLLFNMPVIFFNRNPCQLDCFLLKFLTSSMFSSERAVRRLPELCSYSDSFHVNNILKRFVGLVPY